MKKITLSNQHPVEYNAWKHMIHRCYNTKDGSFNDYGGRSKIDPNAENITVCVEWLASFDNFYNDMGSKPNSGDSLDRKDVNGHYNKDNCRWADQITQANNKRQSKKPAPKSRHTYTKDGETKTAVQWGKILGIHPSTINDRKKRGWSDERCLSTTPQTFGKNCKGRDPNFLKQIRNAARAELAAMKEKHND